MLFEDATYERLLAIRDEASGLRAVLTIDSTRLGPAFGGIRRYRYGSEAQMLADGQRLARSMSRKCALAEVGAGGAKTVVWDRADRACDWPAAYRVLGRRIEALGGEYVAGPDVGTGPAQLSAVREQTSHVNPDGNDAGASTAAGVLAGLRGVAAVLGREPKHIAVQGLGAVGLAVCKAMRAEGVAVTGADIDAAPVAEAAALGVHIVEPDAIVAVDCDIFVPCAMGQGLDATTVPRLGCAAVCGSANDQLADAAAGDQLHARGILHAPDIVVSAGAVIEGVVTVREGASARSRATARRIVDAIEGRVVKLLRQAHADDIAPSRLAIAWADAQLGRA